MKHEPISLIVNYPKRIPYSSMMAKEGENWRDISTAWCCNLKKYKTYTWLDERDKLIKEAYLK